MALIYMVIIHLIFILALFCLAYEVFFHFPKEIINRVLYILLIIGVLVGYYNTITWFERVVLMSSLP